MNKILLIALLLLAKLHINAQTTYDDQIKKSNASAYQYSFNLNGITISNFSGPYSYPDLGDYVNSFFYWCEQPIGTTDKVNCQIFINDLNWDLMLPIIETYPDYLPEDLIMLTISFPVQLKIYLRQTNDGDFIEVPSSRDFNIYVHKSSAESMKNGLIGLSNYHKNK